MLSFGFKAALDANRLLRPKQSNTSSRLQELRLQRRESAMIRKYAGFSLVAFALVASFIIFGGGSSSTHADDSAAPAQATGGATATAPVGATPTLLLTPIFTDGRLDVYNPYQGAAVYCKNGGIQIWKIDPNGNGLLALNIPLSSLPTRAATAAAGSRPVLIASNLGVRLFRNPGGEYQIITTTPKGEGIYTFSFRGC
jgi:hypothetical protein